ncbi:hypothetical protein [Methylomonas sp. MgM2]
MAANLPRRQYQGRAGDFGLAGLQIEQLRQQHESRFGLYIVVLDLKPIAAIRNRQISFCRHLDKIRHQDAILFI